MSFDNSVVDSSVTEWKPHDVENKNNQDSPNEKVDKDAYHSGAEDEDLSCEQVGTSNANKKSKTSETRYFIIKSLNHENIHLSVQRGIWATQVMNEPILEEAYHNCGKVILIFSVNMSGFFQGYAEMISSVGWRRDNVWSHGYGGSKPWGRSFKVKWLRLHDLPFQKTLHLKNPLNNYKPVKISRDCQELPHDIGEALCELIDGENVGMDDNSNQIGYDTFGSLQDKECDVYPSTIMYPQRQGDSSLLFDGWNMSSQRNPHASTNAINTTTLTDDDILEMTYEEYLEAHGRGNRVSRQPVNESSRRSRESSISKECNDDVDSRSHSKRRSRHHNQHHHHHHHHRHRSPK